MIVVVEESLRGSVQIKCTELGRRMVVADEKGGTVIRDLDNRVDQLVGWRLDGYRQHCIWRGVTLGRSPTDPSHWRCVEAIAIKDLIRAKMVDVEAIDEVVVHVQI